MRGGALVRKSCRIELGVMKTMQRIVTVCGTALLIVAVSVVALREQRQPAFSPNVTVSSRSAEVRIKAVERKPELLDHEVVDVSSAVVIVSGVDITTADRYGARNDALRSIARRRDLPEKDVAALVAYLRSRDICTEI